VFDMSATGRGAERRADDFYGGALSRRCEHFARLNSINADEYRQASTLRARGDRRRRHGSGDQVLIPKNCKCGGTLHVARDVTESEEEQANRNEDAAIFRCAACGLRHVDYTSTRPDRYRNPPVPDQAVFK
jgi:hypothetical protein